jgi:hypothetical protein
MCADKSAGVRYGTEAFVLGGFTETLGGIQAAILKVGGPLLGIFDDAPAAHLQILCGLWNLA